MNLRAVTGFATKVPSWVWILVLVGLLPRAVITPGTVPILWPDSLTYLRSATAMVEEGNYWMHEVYRTPVYPFFLSIPFQLFGFEPIAGEVIVACQRVLGILSGLLLYMILRRGFCERVSLISSIVFLWSSLQLFYETSILTEAQFIFLLFLFFWTAGKLLDLIIAGSARWRSFALLGVVAAALSLSRPIGQLLLVLYLGFIVCRFRFRRELIIGAAISMVSFFATVFPWMKVNHDRYGFWGISQDFGINLFHRVMDVDNTPLPPESSDRLIREVYTKHNVGERITYFYVYFAVQRDELRLKTPRKLIPLRTDQRMAAFAMEVLRAHPQYFIPQTLSNLWALFVEPRVSLHFCDDEVTPPVLCSNHPGIFARGFDVHAEHTQGWGRSVTQLVVGAFRLPVGVWSFLFLCGAVVSLRGRGWEHRVLLFVTVWYFTGLAAVFNCAEDRFRLPVDGFMAAFAVAACFQLLSLFRASQRLKR